MVHGEGLELRLPREAPCQGVPHLEPRILGRDGRPAVKARRGELQQETAGLEDAQQLDGDRREEGLQSSCLFPVAFQADREAADNIGMPPGPLNAGLAPAVIQPVEETGRVRQDHMHARIGHAGQHLAATAPIQRRAGIGVPAKTACAGRSGIFR